MKNRILKGLLIAGILTSVTVTQAQDLPHDTLKVMYPGDSTVVEIPSSQDRYIEERTTLTPDDGGKLTSVLRKDSVGTVRKQGRDWSRWRPNPKRTLWLALVIPGTGQAYNHKYWKLSVFYGGFVGCVCVTTQNSQMYHDYTQAYMDIVDNDSTMQSYNNFPHLGATITPADEERYENIFKQRKDHYRRWRDLGISAIIVVYALPVVDVCVGAPLSDSDISGDLSLYVAPTVISDKSIATPNNPFRSSAIGVGYGLTF